MRFFGSVGSVFGGISANLETQVETPDAMRKKHGFTDFFAEMKRIQNYEPQKELKKEKHSPTHQAASISQARK